MDSLLSHKMVTADIAKQQENLLKVGDYQTDFVFACVNYA